MTPAPASAECKKEITEVPVAMKNAFLFLLIFGALLLLAAVSLWFSRDPRNSVFFARVWGDMGREKARKTAKEIAAAVAGVGLAIILYCVIGLIREI